MSTIQLGLFRFRGRPNLRGEGVVTKALAGLERIEGQRGWSLQEKVIDKNCKYKYTDLKI